ncbi:MAG: hypothetical protein IKC22_07480 [Bacilli bacterium]|nr:hypothetical protein [Bacilli bacterium]MBR2892190.1 hypothetical protein [Bacilli bacterium]
MKKLVKYLSFLIVLFTMASCGYQRSESSFFDDSKLHFNLVPNLPQPDASSMVLVDTDLGDGARVYINSEQTAEEYFQRIVEYVESLTFTFCGTVDSIKEYHNNILGKESSYYFRSTKPFSSILASNYYFEDENSYIIVYSNGEIENIETGEYLDDAHLIRVCCESGIYEPKSHIGDDYSFKYNYFIEFGYEPSIWFNDTIGAFKLEIIDEDNHIINKSPAVDTWYAPGTLLKFYANPIMDADLVMYENNQFCKTQTTEKQEEEYVWVFSYVMPTYDVVLKFEVETLEYLEVRNILSIPSISSENIVKVRKEQGNIGISPGSLTNIEYTTDVEDINNVLSILEMSVYEDITDNWQISGGGYTCYSIITEQEQYDIYISNGYILANEKHYKFVGDYIKFNNISLEAHSYTTYLDVFDAYTMDGKIIGGYEGLSEFEFIDYPYDTVPENENLGYLSTEIGILYILTDDIFYTRDGSSFTYFLIVGEKDFGYIYN